MLVLDIIVFCFFREDSLDESGTPFSVESPWSEPPTPSPRFNVPPTHQNNYPQLPQQHQAPHPLSQHQLLRQQQMLRRGGGMAADSDHLGGGYWPRNAGISFLSIIFLGNKKLCSSQNAQDQY